MAGSSRSVGNTALCRVSTSTKRCRVTNAGGREATYARLKPKPNVKTFLVSLNILAMKKRE